MIIRYSLVGNNAAVLPCKHHENIAALLCKHHENGSENATKFAFFPEAFPWNVS